MQFSVRVSYTERKNYDWFKAVKVYEEVGFIEIAFLNPELFLKVEAKDILAPFTKLNLKAPSLHFAQFNLGKLELFKKVFQKTIEIVKALNCSCIVIHPSKGKFKETGDFLKTEIDPVLEKEKIYFCWETFESKKRIFGGLKNIFDHCRSTEYHRVCYDFSHVHKNQRDILKELDQCLELIKIFHISNRSSPEGRKQHYPIFFSEKDLVLDFNEILSFLKEKNFTGHLVLEYLPQFHPQLLPDALKLKKMY